MSEKKNNNDNKLKESDGFFEKLKNDKKYKAKVEILGYGVFILILIIYLNIAGAGSSGSVVNNVNNLENNNSVVNETEEAETLLERLENNYKYDINVSLTHDTETLEDIEEVVCYSGRSYGDSIEIIKSYQETMVSYYKVKDFYYAKDNEEYKIIDEEEVYSFDLGSYIEVADVKKYIEMASLDHVTDYSSGKKEYVYHLKIRDVIKSYTADDNLEISVVIENEILKINIDYSKLISLALEDVSLCKVEFVYTDIDKVEEFKVIEETTTTGSES